jgi:hypothetical protein
MIKATCMALSSTWDLLQYSGQEWFHKEAWVHRDFSAYSLHLSGKLTTYKWSLFQVVYCYQYFYEENVASGKGDQ